MGGKGQSWLRRSLSQTSGFAALEAPIDRAGRDADMLSITLAQRDPHLRRSHDHLHSATQHPRAEAVSHEQGLLIRRTDVLEPSHTNRLSV